MFSKTTEYALRVVVYLASLDGEPATIPKIAAVTDVPTGYLAKVLRSLAKSQIISSQRGLHGGSILARSPEEITIYDVVQVVEPIARIRTCPLSLKTHGVHLCPLHRRLDDAMASVEHSFRSASIAQLISQPHGNKPLCETPANASNKLTAVQIPRGRKPSQRR